MSIGLKTGVTETGWKLRARLVPARARHSRPEFFGPLHLDECHRTNSMLDRPQRLRVNRAPTPLGCWQRVQRTFCQTRTHSHRPRNLATAFLRSPRAHSDFAFSPYR